jgi:MFS family permease
VNILDSNAVPTRVALYLALVQCLFALGWTVYVLFLPELLTRAGVDKSWTPWVLALDQVIFAAADLAMGVAVDRARSGLRRVGPLLLGLTAVSSLAMLLLPTASAMGSGVFLALTMLWVASSAALRAPPFALLGRYAAKPALPRLVALQLFGLALASALAPYLGLTLSGIDPSLPFAIASLTILASSGGLVWAERQLINQAPATAGSGTPLPFRSPLAMLMMAGLFAAALGFQWHAAINAAAQIKRAGDASWLPLIMPVFWAGFAFGLLPAAALGERLGQARAAALGCVIGAMALAASTSTTSISSLAMAHALAGAGWALTMDNAISLASTSGKAGAEGRYTALFFSVLAIGTLTRIVLGLAGTPQMLGTTADWLPVLAWASAAILLLHFAARKAATVS